MPVIAYNVPSRTGLRLTGDVVYELAQIKGIAGIKEASGDIALAEDIILKTRGQLPLYSGCDELTVPLLSIGGTGVISVVSNLFPRAVKKMVDSFFNGDISKAAEMQVEMKPLINMLFSAVNPIPVKTALSLMGYSMGGLRLPLCELDKEEIKDIEDVLNEYIQKYGEK
ncbi:MAG: hypothetical protein E7315_05005 [Clostridiales bacterium]|nr:hypothetical protein [Clostridiales bacterium]